MEHVARRSGEENIEPAAWRLFDDRELRDRYGRYYGRESTPLHGPVSLFDEE